MHLTQYDLAVGFSDDTLAVAGNPTNQDVIREVDQARIEADLDRQIDDLSQATRDWLLAHSGVMALWDKAKGGADLSVLTAFADDIQTQLDAANILDPLVRVRVQKRLTKARAAIAPTDWRMAALTIIGLAVLKWGWGTGIAHAKRHYKRRYEKE